MLSLTKLTMPKAIVAQTQSSLPSFHRLNTLALSAVLILAWNSSARIPDSHSLSAIVSHYSCQLTYTDFREDDSRLT